MTGGSPPGADGDARRVAPAAARNRAPITAEIRRLAPAAGQALEIASGSGEHVIAFAEAVPEMTWQPSDPDAGQRASIAAWIAASGLGNVSAPMDIDISRPGWHRPLATADMIVTINLLHLIPDAAMERAFDGFARCLAPGGVVLVYGPFLREGKTTSAGDAAFHADLKARDPAIGYKDVDAVIRGMRMRGLDLSETIDMPANNLLLVLRRRGAAP